MLGINLGKPVCWAIVPLALSLTGCGLTQRVSDGTQSVMSSMFYKNVNVLHLDFSAREALNTDARESDSLSESVVVRVYQLKDIKQFNISVYQQLLKNDEEVLGNDLLASHEVVIKPGGDIQLDVPLEKEANFVAVAGLFRHPDIIKNSWKLMIDRESLEPDKARVIEAGSHYLTLHPLKAR